MKILLPDGWKAPIGYSNGISVDAGQIVFTAGQVGWDVQQNFKSEEISSQFYSKHFVIFWLCSKMQVVSPRAHLPDHRILH